MASQWKPPHQPRSVGPCSAAADTASDSVPGAHRHGLKPGVGERLGLHEGMTLIRSAARPTAPPPRMSQALLTRTRQRSSPVRAAIRMVMGSVMASPDSCAVTPAMRPRAAALTPSRSAAVHSRSLIRRAIGVTAPTKMKEGRKMAMVATTAPGTPARTQPMKVAVVKTGPGVNWPMATASRSWSWVRTPSCSTRSFWRKARRTYPDP